MDEAALRHLIGEVERHRLDRRGFIDSMLALGLTAPLAAAMLGHAGSAQAQAALRSAYKPTRRGGGGALKLLWWQGPTLLNPHFAVGTKDQEAARIFYEPLAAWDNEGNLVPVLAAEIPTRENGGLSADGLSVTWKLKPDVQWHDGRPFTADDVVFNWEYASDPATAAATIGIYNDLKVEKLDPRTVRVRFAKPSPFWAAPFVGTSGMIIPKHLFEAYKGARSREAPANLRPVGTGPYKFVDFKPGDSVRGEINPAYHLPNRPHFDSLELKGGGDAVSAARAVLQTGEFDYAWNPQVEDEILKRLEAAGKGRVAIIPGGNVEFIAINFTDPTQEIDGERSSLKSRHPTLSDAAVRQALALLVDRGAIQEHIYGRTGVATANFLNNPERLRSRGTRWEFNVDKANAVLEAAGWKRGPDGIRAREGRRLRFVFQTAINAPRQKTQQIVKQAAQRAGIDIELKSITASVFFSSDVANPDTFAKFNADLQLLQLAMTRPDPETFMEVFCSWTVAARENKWQGRNFSRWRNADYDRAFRAAELELDPVKRAALFIRMNDLVFEHQAALPIVNRPKVAAIGTRLRGPVSGWDNDLAFLSDWYREA